MFIGGRATAAMSVIGGHGAAVRILSLRAVGDIVAATTRSLSRATASACHL